MGCNPTEELLPMGYTPHRITREFVLFLCQSLTKYAYVTDCYCYHPASPFRWWWICLPGLGWRRWWTRSCSRHPAGPLSDGIYRPLAGRELMRLESGSVLTINGGSSSIRFAVYEAGAKPKLRAAGKIDRIGLSGTNLILKEPLLPKQLPLSVSKHQSQKQRAMGCSPHIRA